MNDTSESVTAHRSRDDACTESRGETTTLAPSASVEVPTDDQRTPNPYKLVDAPGDLVGCFPLIVDGRPEKEPVVVRVSEAVTCRENYE